MPVFNFEERLKKIQDSKLADEIVVGDKVIENWQILKKTNPGIIAIGYDQKDLETSLKKHLFHQNRYWDFWERVGWKKKRD